VVVTLIDFCQCPGGRLLDLYSDAFERLGPLSRGVLKVTVTW
jgi:rare lipoprotein A (peptidoglycan hydrolase)